LFGAAAYGRLSPKDQLAVITLSQQFPMRQLGRAVKPVVYAAIDRDQVT